MTDLSFILCEPVGGVNIPGLRNATSSPNTSMSMPTPMAFTGDAVRAMAGSSTWVFATVAIGFFAALLVL